MDPAFVLVAGGPGARKFFDGGDHADEYWLRVWGARGLLWVWDDKAIDEIRLALHDDHWRVREMALKVMARNRLGDELADTEPLRTDPVPRVRQAAARAQEAITRAQA